eukprot:93645-Rhodomonas_salina.1
MTWTLIAETRTEVVEHGTLLMQCECVRLADIGKAPAVPATEPTLVPGGQAAAEEEEEEEDDQ